jgi:glycosyltransferase involved in cell wall biosynthesis
MLELPRRPVPFGTIFGYAARLERGKGPAELLQAFARLTDRCDGTYLRLAGVGPLSYSARKQSRRLGLDERVEFTGSYSTTVGRAAFLQSLDVFVLPSFAEGTPNSIIEAMAVGLPVIASSVGGIPDMVTTETGILVPPGDAAALEEAMHRLASDHALRTRMGAAAKRRYEDLYSPRAALPRLLDVYARVAHEHGVGEASRHRVARDHRPQKVELHRA